MSFWVSVNDQTFGPYSLEEIGELLEDGRITPETPAVPEGADEWGPLSELINIRPAPPQPSAPAPMMVPARSGFAGATPGYQYSGGSPTAIQALPSARNYSDSTLWFGWILLAGGLVVGLIPKAGFVVWVIAAPILIGALILSVLAIVRGKTAGGW